MNSTMPAQNSPWQLSFLMAQGLRRFTLTLIILATSACSSLSSGPVARQELFPLQLADRTVGMEDITFLAPTPDLLALDEEMEAFVALYTQGLRSQRQRLMQLHRSMKGAGVLNLQYDPFAEGSAIEAFHRGNVNCLSYAHLFVAMAREAGLDASYQWVDIRPQWSRMGERVAVRLHVNVVVKVRGGEEFMADIDPLQPRDITSTHVISDRDAEALYHSNIAMDALSEERMAIAWANAARALEISPEMPHLWVNLGAVYRINGQHAEAEQSYLHALKLDARDRSAMNNLMVLYGMQGRTDEQAYWQKQITRYQNANPYYHAAKGDIAGEKGNWSEALVNYQQAVRLSPQDSRLLYATGLIHSRLEELEAASRLISKAIEHATLRSEVRNYQTQLEVVRQQQLAGL